jgi:aldehyde:ferredoxin oxidoreductase
VTARGAILEVDLSTGAWERRPTPEGLVEGYLGGRGLGARLLWPLAPGTPADAPETPMAFCPGLLDAFPTPGTSRSAVVTKSPLTRPLAPRFPGSATITYANLGGYFGAELKYAGLDALVIRGRAREPALLVVDGAEVRIEPARELWGMTSSRTEDALRARLPSPDRPFRTVYVGPAGENGVRFASIMHDVSRAFARGGVGWVMGSKRLKAIALRGRELPGVTDDAGYRRGVDELRAHFVAQQGATPYRNKRRFGSLGSFWAMRDQRVAVRNFSQGRWDEMSDYAERAARTFVHHHTCFACPIACRKSSRVESGPAAGFYREAAHFEHAAMLGANCGLSDEAAIPRLAEACNEQGLDVISMGNVLGFLMDARARGLVPAGFLGGQDLRWGDWRGMEALIERTGARSGVGDLLSQGVEAVARAAGRAAEAIAFHAKGHEFAGWNPKGEPAMGLAYATASRGACHLFGEHPGGQDRQALLDSIGGCYFVRRMTDYEILARLVSAVVGRTYTEAGLVAVGERVVNLERCFNAREGFTADDDRRSPAALTREPLAGAAQGCSEEWLAHALTTCYQSRGWSRETGLPGRATLERLGLGFAAADLEAL